jgi:hypothetical protein
MKDKPMFQIAAALLFAVAAGLGVAVIIAMLKNNGDAILSALFGEGAFSVDPAFRPGAAPQGTAPRRARRNAPRPARAAISARFSRAA